MSTLVKYESDKAAECVQYCASTFPLHSDCLYVYERLGLIEKMMGVEFGVTESVKHIALMHDAYSNNVVWVVWFKGTRAKGNSWPRTVQITPLGWHQMMWLR